MKKAINEIRISTKVIKGNVLVGEERAIKFSGFENEKNGKIVTQSTAQTFVKKYWRWNCINPLVDNVYVDFNERIISLLLSQEDCAGIRCYFAKDLCDKTTLVLVGIKSNGDDLGTKINPTTIPRDEKDLNRSIILQDIGERTTNAPEPCLIVEVGGGNNIENIEKSLKKANS